MAVDTLGKKCRDLTSPFPIVFSTLESSLEAAAATLEAAITECAVRRRRVRPHVDSLDTRPQQARVASSARINDLRQNLSAFWCLGVHGTSWPCLEDKCD